MHAFYNKHKHQLVTNYKNITHTGVPPVGDLTEVKPGHNAHTLTSLVGARPVYEMMRMFIFFQHGSHGG